jgi:CBS domain-containing protein
MQATRPQTIDGRMSPLPITISPTVHASYALAQMESVGVAHLVVDMPHGPCVVTRAELRAAIRAGRDALVGAVLDPLPIRVARDTPAHRVVTELRECKASAALVFDCDSVVGIVTITDLLGWLEETVVPDSSPAPEHVRARILAEHARILAEIEIIEALAARTQEGTFEPAALRERLRVLEGVLRGHLELEERVVLPWLRDADGFGPERARHMEAEHALQRATLDGILLALFTTRSVPELATRTRELCRALRDDIETEEQAFLTEDGPLARVITVGFGG